LLDLDGTVRQAEEFVEETAEEAVLLTAFPKGCFPGYSTWVRHLWTSSLGRVTYMGETQCQWHGADER